MTQILITCAQSETFYLQITGAQYRHYVNIYYINVSAQMSAHAILGRVSHPTFVQCSCKISHGRNYSGYTVVSGSLDAT